MEDSKILFGLFGLLIGLLIGASLNPTISQDEIAKQYVASKFECEIQKGGKYSPPNSVHYLDFERP